MAYVPGGTFVHTEHHGGKPPEAKVSAFCMDVTEVTAYIACTAAKSCTPSTGNPQECNDRNADHKNHPINCVDWTQPNAFCTWKGKKRLPTNEEWGWAATGGPN